MQDPVGGAASGAGMWSGFTIFQKEQGAEQSFYRLRGGNPLAVIPKELGFAERSLRSEENSSYFGNNPRAASFGYFPLLEEESNSVASTKAIKRKTKVPATEKNIKQFGCEDKNCKKET